MTTAPNIIYILADDMGIGDLSCYGAEKIVTPNMDRLASEGLRFTDAHSSSAVCTPSRYSILTGRNCWRTRLQQWVIGGFGRPLIEPEQSTLPRMLQEQGYRTYGVGKWHLGFEWQNQAGELLPFEEADDMNAQGFNVDYTQRLAGGPLDVGFDHYFGISGSMDMPPYCYIEGDHVITPPVSEKAHYYNQQRRGMHSPDYIEEQVDMRFAEEAVGCIQKHHTHAGEQPFFLYLAASAPHRPCEVAPEFVKGQSAAGDRGDMVLLFDWMVGQILDTLDTLGISENTMVIVTSDNGARITCANGQDYGHAANGVYRGQKADIWEGGHREPFLVRWPQQIEAQGVCNQLIGLSDMYATVADILGVAVDRDQVEDSISFLSLLKDPQASATRETLIHHSGEGHFSIRRGDYKFILGNGSGGFTEPVGKREPLSRHHCGQLYNLSIDPGETTNLFDTSPNLVRDLRRLLIQEIAQ
ncbi:arylsulfatase [Coraliomargarita sp. SDUM461004]|uniref:Arylsulfatase n=1 Tax=Thalassobacterium sedimentorum TaxID=3041258 RepID=A0ABU1AG75_9BACT|nr:arylsulfatase [Coraliomargarita sp. SDUM461004]MDQ8193783.1 arylsulfatase [Coraliomargarita sp. SDUM461004]